MASCSSISLAVGRWPVVGHSAAMLRDPAAFLATLPAQGDLVRIRFGPAEVVAVCDPLLMRRALVDDQIFDHGGPIFERAAEVFGSSGLGTCPRQDHRRQRRLCQPAFHRDRIAEYNRTMTAEITACVDRWHDGQTLDVVSEMNMITTRTLARTMFSTGLSSTGLRQLVDDFTVIVGQIYWRSILPPVFSRLPTPGARRYRAANTHLRKTVNAIIASRRMTGGERGDLLGALMSAESASDKSLSDVELGDQVVNFFLAGSQTAAYAIAWAFHLLSLHTDVATRLDDEVDTVLAGNSASVEHLDRLDLTRRIITESLRLYPPAWMFTRVVTVDTSLGSHILPAGTVLLCSPYIVHHRKDLFDKPGDFDPDRWLDDAASSPRNAFVPFGAGPHKCIGEQYGMTECVLALATIAARWNLRALTNTRIKPALGVALSPGGLKLRVTGRTQ